MSVTFFHNPKCSTSRNALALGEPTGGALFNMGVASQVLKKHAKQPEKPCRMFGPQWG